MLLIHNTVDRYAKFEQAVQKDVMGRVKEVEAEISFIKEREKDCHYFGDLLAAGEIPLRVTHNDTKLNNVLFDKASGNAICVIDLDTVMPGFAAHDLGLYLDTHPNAKAALDLRNFYLKQYNNAMNRYQKQFGALGMNDENLNETPFQWVQSPWPWEGK